MLNLRPRALRPAYAQLGAAAPAPAEGGSNFLWLGGTLLVLWAIAKIWKPAERAYASRGTGLAMDMDYKATLASSASKSAEPHGDWANKDIFVKYFRSFYGPRGVYPDVLPGLSKHEIMRGIEMRMRSGDFDGDSIDREVIRDFILESRTGRNVESEWKRGERGHGRPEAGERKQLSAMSARYKPEGSWDVIEERGPVILENTDAIDTKTGERYPNGAWRVRLTRPVANHRGRTWYGDLAQSNAQALFRTILYAGEHKLGKQHGRASEGEGESQCTATTNAWGKTRRCRKEKGHAGHHVTADVIHGTALAWQSPSDTGHGPPRLPGEVVWDVAASERKLGKKQLDKEIERIFYQHGSGIQFNIMDLGKIHSAGRDAYLAGQPMEPAIVEAIAKYRQN